MMKKLVLMASLCVGLAACGERQANTTDESATTAGNTTTTQTTTTATASFPAGARIVEEKGVTYRIDADGTRVQLGPTDSRIVVDSGVRYRVDPDGTRVRIDPQGTVIDVDVPDVRVGINQKGNPDVDVVTNRR
jgi:hypothetical protein